MAVQLSYAFRAQIQETLASGVDGATSPVIDHSAFDDVGTLTANTTVPVTNCIVRTIALVAGAYTIDLTTITGTNGAVQDGTGKKVRFWRVKPTGANSMTFAEGASNGYEMFGNGWSKTVHPDCNWMEELKNNAPTIGGSAKTIDVTGTGTQSFEITCLVG